MPETIDRLWVSPAPIVTRVDTSELEAIEKMRSTFSTLDKHGARYLQHFDPSPGSPLADDDSTWPLLPLSQHAWAALAAVYDHLDITRMTIEQQRLFPTGVYSLMRGALLGSCQALWLVSPEDSAERQERGRRFSEEWYRRRIEYQSEFTPDLEIHEAARSARQLKRFDHDLAEVRLMRTTRIDFQATRIVREAAEAAFPDAHIQREVVREWRRLSGDAHALGWALMTQTTSWDSDDGPSSAVVTGSAASLANVYLASWLIYGKARRRLFELGEVSYDQ
jgi:hypothetical protein